MFTFFLQPIIDSQRYVNNRKVGPRTPDRQPGHPVVVFLGKVVNFF